MLAETYRHPPDLSHFSLSRVLFLPRFTSPNHTPLFLYLTSCTKNIVKPPIFITRCKKKGLRGLYRFIAIERYNCHKGCGDPRLGWAC